MFVADAWADALLADALAALLIGNRHAVTSIAVAATAERITMVLHLLPVRGAAHDIFTQSNALLVVTPVDRAAVPTAEVLQGLFDLTPAEARVARGIGMAETIDALADATGVNRETVRSQVYEGRIVEDGPLAPAGARQPAGRQGLAQRLERKAPIL